MMHVVVLLIILPTMAGGVPSFLCHLGGDLFGQISVCLHDLLQSLVCVGEGAQYQVEGIFSLLVR